jgi:hypothetical protein
MATSFGRTDPYDEEGRSDDQARASPRPGLAAAVRGMARNAAA